MENNHFKVAVWITELLDNQFAVGKFKFGLEPLIGLVPVLGDIITFGLSLYLLWIASSMGAPQNLRNKMMRNIVFDFVIGLVPVVGDVSDFFFKSNTRNLRILRDWVSTLPIEGEVLSSRKVSAAG
jgi:hypothetical protein